MASSTASLSGSDAEDAERIKALKEEARALQEQWSAAAKTRDAAQAHDRHLKVGTRPCTSLFLPTLSLSHLYPSSPLLSLFLQVKADETRAAFDELQ